MKRTQQAWNRFKSVVAACWEAVAGDFDYSKDCFFGWDLCMILAGVRFNTTNVRKRRLWNVYRVAIMFPSVTLNWNLVRSIVQREKLDIVLSIVEFAVTLLMCIGVTVIYRRNYQQLILVRCYVNQRSSGRDRDSSFLARSKSFYKARRMMLSLGLAEACAVISLFFLDNSSNYLVKIPFNVRDWSSVLQTICEALSNSLVFGGAAMVMLTFAIPPIFLFGMQTELSVIAESFGLIYERASNRSQLKMESEPGSSNQCDTMTSYYILKYAHEEFKECIQLHQRFLEQLNLIRPTLNGIFLLIYYTNAVCIACGVFYLLYVKTFSLYAAITLYGVGVLTFACGCSTRYVTQLTEMHESIGEQVYNLDWPPKLEFIPQLASEYRSMRATILTVMIESQQPLRLNCFGFFEFTQEQFTELVDMTYSLVGFFRNFV